MAVRFVCGAECGLAGTGATQPTGTLRHWSAVGSGFLPVTSPVRSGVRSWQLSVGVGTTQTQMTATHTFASAIASGGTIVARFYVYINSVLTNSGDRMGKPKQRVETDISVKLQGVLASAIITPGTLPAQLGSAELASPRSAADLPILDIYDDDE